MHRFVKAVFLVFLLRIAAAEAGFRTDDCFEQDHDSEQRIEYGLVAVRHENSAAARRCLAEGYAAAERFDEAVEHYREALGLKPDAVERALALGGLTRIHLKTSALDEAGRTAREFEAAARLAHDADLLLYAYRLRGAVYMGRGQPGKALDYYHSLLASYKKPSAARTVLYRLLANAALEQKDHPLALAYTELARADAEAVGDAAAALEQRLSRIHILALMQRFHQALQEADDGLRQAEALSGSDAALRWWSMRGSLLLRLGRWMQAFEAYERAYREVEPEGWSEHLRGILDSMLTAAQGVRAGPRSDEAGRLFGIVAEAAAARELDDVRARALAGLALHAVALGETDPQAATAALEQAEAAAEGLYAPEARAWLLWAEAELGDGPEARAAGRALAVSRFRDAGDALRADAVEEERVPPAEGWSQARIAETAAALHGWVLDYAVDRLAAETGNADPAALQDELRRRYAAPMKTYGVCALERLAERWSYDALDSMAWDRLREEFFRAGAACAPALHVALDAGVSPSSDRNR